MSGPDHYFANQYGNQHYTANQQNRYPNQEYRPVVDYHHNMNSQSYQNSQPVNQFQRPNPVGSSTYPISEYRTDSGSGGRYASEEQYKYNRAPVVQPPGRRNISSYDPSGSNVTNYSPYPTANVSDTLNTRSDYGSRRPYVTEFDPDKCREQTVYNPPEVPNYVPLADAYRERKKLGIDKKSEPVTPQKVDTSDVLSEVLKHQKKEGDDPTIENILKSIGFDFELSRKTQERAKKEREALEILKKSKTDSREFGIQETDTSSFLDSDISTVDIKDIFDKKLHQDEVEGAKSVGDRTNDTRNFRSVDRDLLSNKLTKNDERRSVHMKMETNLVRNPSPKKEERFRVPINEEAHFASYLRNESRSMINFKSRNTSIPSSRRIRLNDDSVDPNTDDITQLGLANRYRSPDTNISRNLSDTSNTILDKHDEHSYQNRTTNSSYEEPVKNQDFHHMNQPNDKEYMEYDEESMDYRESKKSHNQRDGSIGKLHSDSVNHRSNSNENNSQNVFTNDQALSMQGTEERMDTSSTNEVTDSERRIGDKASTIKADASQAAVSVDKDKKFDMNNPSPTTLTESELEKLYKEREEKRCRLSAMESQLQILRRHEEEVMRKGIHKQAEQQALLIESQQVKEELQKEIQEVKVTIESNKRKIRDAIEEENLRSSKRPRLKISGKYTDEGNYWCPECAIRIRDFDALFRHLNSTSHSKSFTVTRRAVDEKISEEVFEGPEVEGGPVQGTEFIFRVDGYFCDLCKEYIHGRSATEKHLLSDRHNRETKEFYRVFPSYNRLREIDSERESLSNQTEKSRSESNSSRSRNEKDHKRTTDDYSKSHSTRETEHDKSHNDRTSGRGKINISIGSDSMRDIPHSNPLPPFKDVPAGRTRERDHHRSRQNRGSPESRSRESQFGRSRRPDDERHDRYERSEGKSRTSTGEEVSSRTAPSRNTDRIQADSERSSSHAPQPDKQRLETQLSGTDPSHDHQSSNRESNNHHKVSNSTPQPPKPPRPGLLPLSMLKRGPRANLQAKYPDTGGATASDQSMQGNKSESLQSASTPSSRVRHPESTANIPIVSRNDRSNAYFRSMPRNSYGYQQPQPVNIAVPYSRKTPADPQLDMFDESDYRRT